MNLHIEFSIDFDSFGVENNELKLNYKNSIIHVLAGVIDYNDELIKTFPFNRNQIVILRQSANSFSISGN